MMGTSGSGDPSRSEGAWLRPILPTYKALAKGFHGADRPGVSVKFGMGQQK